MAAARFLVRLVGWLFTPLVALVGAFLGAWVGVTIGGAFRSSSVAAWIMLGFGAISGLAAAWAWLRFLRQHPWLQQRLAVAPDGTPLVAIPEEPPNKSG